MTLNDPGLVRVLNNLESGIADVREDIRKLNEKVEDYVHMTITKEEFDAYKDLRRATVRWAVATIISVGMLLIAAVTVIVSTRPGM